MFFKTFAKALKLKDVRRKLFNIFIALLIYRLGAHIYLPALNLKLINYSIFKSFKINLKSSSLQAFIKW